MLPVVAEEVRNASSPTVALIVMVDCIENEPPPGIPPASSDQSLVTVTSTPPLASGHMLASMWMWLWLVELPIAAPVDALATLVLSVTSASAITIEPLIVRFEVSVIDVTRCWSPMVVSAVDCDAPGPPLPDWPIAVEAACTSAEATTPVPTHPRPVAAVRPIAVEATGSVEIPVGPIEAGSMPRSSRAATAAAERCSWSQSWSSVPSAAVRPVRSSMLSCMARSAVERPNGEALATASATMRSRSVWPSAALDGAAVGAVADAPGADGGGAADAPGADGVGFDDAHDATTTVTMVRTAARNHIPGPRPPIDRPTIWQPPLASAAHGRAPSRGQSAGATPHRHRPAAPTGAEAWRRHRSDPDASRNA